MADKRTPVPEVVRRRHLPRTESAEREKALGEQSPRELARTVDAALFEVHRRLEEISRHHGDSHSYELHIRVVTERLARSQEAIQILATHSEPEAHDLHSHASEQFFHALGAVEKILNGVDRWRSNNSQESVHLATPEPDDFTLQAMQEAKARLKSPVPNWVISVVAADLGHEQQAAYLDGSLDEFATEEAAMDNWYTDLVDGSEGVRRSGFVELLPGMLLRAVKYRETDPDDIEGNLHRFKNLLEHLRDDWENRYPPVALRYAVLMRYAEELVELTDEALLEEPVDEDDAEIMEIAEAAGRPGEITTAIERSVQEVIDTLFRLRHEHRAHGYRLKLQLEEQLEEALDLLDDLNRADSVIDDAYERADRAVMHRVLQAEVLMNAVDEARIEGLSGPLRAEWAPLNEGNDYLESVRRTALELGVQLPGWMVDYIAADIISRPGAQEYMDDDQTAALDRAQDEEYQELLADVPAGAARRLRLHALFGEYILRAVKSYADDPHDNSGEQVRAKNITDMLILEWESYLPAVTNKYKDILFYWNDLMEVLAAEFYPARLVDRALDGDQSVEF